MRRSKRKRQAISLPPFQGCSVCTTNLFTNLLLQATTLIENHNTSEQEQPKDVIPPETTELSTPVNESPTPTPSEIKEQTSDFASQLPNPKPQTSNLEPRTSNIEPQTESMEVHKHPHHVMHKKKWSEYLLEFFMIFLAVFLGFIAENIRESYSETKSAKEYAGLLINDLASDTSELSRTSYVLKRIINCGDSLSALVNSNVSLQDNGGKMYYYEYWSGWRWRVTPNNTTLKQLESSGSLRYLGNASLIKKILDYEESLKVIALLETNFEEEKTENWKLVQKVFYQTYFDSLDNIKSAARDSSSQISHSDDHLLTAFLNTNYPLITYDKNLILELSNWALNSSRSYRVQIHNVDFAKRKAEETIADLKEEYHLQISKPN
jgi:hypothetical protein